MFVTLTLTGLVLTIFLVYLFSPVARHIGLVDRPSERKRHDGHIPLSGGVAMFCALMFTVLILPQPLSDLRGLFAALFILVITGVLDDLHELSTTPRFAAQIFAALLLIFVNDSLIYDLGALFHAGQSLELVRWLAMPFTVFAVVGVINAMNMIDGLDGLAGGQALITLTGSGIAVYLVQGAGNLLQLIGVLAAVLLGFLWFNMRFPWQPRARIFMGDSGSMFLGLLIAWLLILLSQGQIQAITPVSALWLFALPLFDTISLMLRRVSQGRSPFQADREHCHHLVMHFGFSHAQTAWILLSISAAFAATGLTGLHLGFPEWLMFWGFLLLFGVYFGATHYLWNYHFPRQLLMPEASSRH